MIDKANAVLLAALVTVCALYSAWRRHAVKCVVPLRGPAPSSFLLGNSPDLYSGPHGLAYHHTLAATYGRAFKVHMLAGEEQIYLSDTRALHHVLVRDTHVFDETPAMMSEFYYCFGPGLISVHGDTHKKQRKMIQPLFGAAHMRVLTPTFWDIAYQARDVIRAKVACASDAGKAPSAVLDLWKWSSRAALEGVGVGALGYSFDALDDETEDNAYMVAARELPYTVYPLRKFMPICVWCMRNLPVWLQRALARVTPVPRVQKVCRIVETLQRNSEALYAAKKAALREGDAEVAAQVGAGNDVMSVLMKANMAAAANEKECLPDDEVMGQMNTLISAAHDTTSSALAHMIYCLAQDLPRQRRLREELAQARSDTFGEFDYHTVTTLPFLDACYRETLRLYAPASFQHRTATEAITVPLSAPIELSNGELISALPIAKGQTVVVAIEAVNRDPAIWGPDADTWLPERWLTKGSPASVQAAGVPGAFSHTLTFLGGNRSCIGMKFSEIELKTILIALVENFEFAPAPGQEEVKWRLSLVQTPAQPGREHLDEPELPLLVTTMKPRSVDALE
ncbi:cytochrome P450 [Mycena pura]|uniref:Cytochrome P450 n=1 Tax=Mycena pura TaxID=153505 RepID=A0AAD7E1U5_9AGAR|nr:cytochrome P450 [Mycena pura]